MCVCVCVCLSFCLCVFMWVCVFYVCVCVCVIGQSRQSTAIGDFQFYAYAIIRLISWSVEHMGEKLTVAKCC